MIDFKKRCLCDSCGLTSGNENMNTEIYHFTLTGTGRTFSLCGNCLKEISEAMQGIVKKEGIE